MLDGVELGVRVGCVAAVRSPPVGHRPAALGRGKHVLCEKPMAMSVAQCEAMCAAARDAGTVAAIAHEFRYLPTRQALKELVDNGHLGALREIETVHQQSSLRAANVAGSARWWFERESGGGVTGAILSHHVDASNWLAGRPPQHVVGFSRTANPLRRDARGEAFTSTVDDGAFALLYYGDGLVGRFAIDSTLAVESSTLGVHGELRTAVASGPRLLEARLFAVDDDETSELELKSIPHAELSSVHPNLPAFVTLLDHFVAAIDGEADASLPTFADGLETQRVLEAVGFGFTEVDRR